MRKELVTLLCVLVFAAGFFLGRAFPPRHYDRYGNGPLLVNSSTGKICNPFKSTQESARNAGAKSDAAFFGQPQTATKPDVPLAPITPLPTVSELTDPTTYVPSCGEE